MREGDSIIKKILKRFNPLEKENTSFKTTQYDSSFEGLGKLNKIEKDHIIGFCKKGIIPDEYILWNIDERTKKYLAAFDGSISDTHWSAFRIAIDYEKFSKKGDTGKAKQQKKLLINIPAASCGVF